MSLKDIKGLGPKTEAILNELSIESLYDLVTFFPKRYDHYKIVPIKEASPQEAKWHQGLVTKNPSIFNVRKNLTRITVEVQSGDYTFTLVVFNQTYILKLLNVGTTVVFLAKIDLHYKQVNAQSIRLKKNFEEGIMPVYNIDSVGDAKMLNYVHQALPIVLPKVHDYIPLELKEKYKLIDKATLLKEAHNPSGERILKQVMRRLKYEELFLYQLKVQYLKYQRAYYQGAVKNYNLDLIKTLIKDLPFELTEGQKMATNEIFKDLKSPHVMLRMLQGDTGSGKTVIAFLAMLAVMSSQHQVAFMAPTELLATQHAETFEKLFKHSKFRLKVLKGSLSLSDRKAIVKALRDGTIDGVFGTHVLFSKDIRFQSLGLVITDEQHRFGVMQRDRLKHKGSSPDVLYLSATPIPRTLAMTLFSDIDLSVIKEKPEGRKVNKTEILPIKKAKTLNPTILETLEQNQQVYIVAPRIETKDDDLISVEQLFDYYRKIFAKYHVGLLHGKMQASDKDKVLKAFKQGAINILVSTTVIEVGIHVDNANLMLIYHAERFGYAQIHQLRGRVGRNKAQGLCYLLYQGDEFTQDRLEILKTTHDGFELSEYDLKNRGFGDVLGTMQSGYKTFKYSNDFEDIKILKLAKEDAIKIIDTYIYNRNTLNEALIDYLETIDEM